MCQIIDHCLQDDGVVIDHPQNSVALITQEAPTGFCDVAMVNNEMMMQTAVGRGRVFADSTDPILSDKKGIVVSFSDSVFILKTPVSAILLIPLFHCRSSLLLVKSAIFFICQLFHVLTLPRPLLWVSGNDIHLTKTPCAPTTLGVDVDLSKSVLKIDSASALPSAQSDLVFLDGDYPTTTTGSAAIGNIEIAQEMNVSSLFPTVPTDVFHGFVLGPSSSILVSGSSDRFVSTSAVAQAVGDLTLGIAA